MTFDLLDLNIAGMGLIQCHPIKALPQSRHCVVAALCAVALAKNVFITVAWKVGRRRRKATTLMSELIKMCKKYFLTLSC